MQNQCGAESQAFTFGKEKTNAKESDSRKKDPHSYLKEFWDSEYGESPS
jgi:hypothetical protein